MQSIRGLTLVELLIALGIVAVIATLAIPPAQIFLNKRAVANHMQQAVGFIREGVNLARRSECAVKVTLTQDESNIALNMDVESEPSVECRNWLKEVGNSESISEFTPLLRNSTLGDGVTDVAQRSYRIEGTSGAIQSQFKSQATPFSISRGKGDTRVTGTAQVSSEGINEVTYD